MDVPRLLAPRRVQPLGRLAPVIWFFGWALLVQASSAGQPSPDLIGAAAEFSGAPGDLGRGHAAETLEEVIVGPDGVLHGRVFETSGGFAAGGVDGLRVRFVGRQSTLAVTATDKQGRFALPNLPPGQYTVEVDGPNGISRRTCRVWSCRAAPPQARSEVNVPLRGTALRVGGLVVRGRYPSPFPIMSLRQAAMVTGIASGALAAPVIYHNTLVDNRVPASP